MSDSLLKQIHDDLLMRAEGGVVNLSHGLWEKLCEAASDEQDLKVFNLSCYSDCGGYFQPYLQTLTVVAKSPEHAVSLALEWMKDHYKFLSLNVRDWEISQVAGMGEGVVDYTLDTDY